MQKYLFGLGMLLIFIGFSGPAQGHEDHTAPPVSKKEAGKQAESATAISTSKSESNSNSKNESKNVNTLQISQIVSAESKEKTSDRDKTEESHKKRTGFFAVDFINEFNLTVTKLFQYHDSSLDLKFGGQLMPQHTAELGIRLSSLASSAVLLKYNYDFISEENWSWIPGVSGTVLLGVTPYVVDASSTRPKPRYLTYGGNVEVFLRKFVSKNVSAVIRLGVSHELIAVVGPDFSDFDVSAYVSVGVRWYLR